MAIVKLQHCQNNKTESMHMISILCSYVLSNRLWIQVIKVNIFFHSSTFHYNIFDFCNYMVQYHNKMFCQLECLTFHHNIFCFCNYMAQHHNKMFCRLECLTFHHNIFCFCNYMAQHHSKMFCQLECVTFHHNISESYNCIVYHHNLIIEEYIINSC